VKSRAGHVLCRHAAGGSSPQLAEAVRLHHCEKVARVRTVQKDVKAVVPRNRGVGLEARDTIAGTEALMTWRTPLSTLHLRRGVFWRQRRPEA